MPKTLRTLLLLFLLVAGMGLLTACGSGAGDGAGPGGDDGPSDGGGDDDGGGDGSGGGSDPVSRLGFVMVEERDVASGGTAAHATAYFMRLEGDIPAAEADPAAGLDTCFVYDSSEPPPDIGHLPDVTLTWVDAGDPVTIDAAGAAYLVLNRTETPSGETTLITYELPDDAAFEPPIATDLSVTIPGSEAFPAFTDVPQPDVPTFQLTAPTDRAVDAETTFTWTGAPTSATSFLTLNARSSGTSATTIVSCTVTDDGSFAFPAATVAEMGAGFEGTLTSMYRVATETIIEGDTALYLMSQDGFQTVVF